MLNTWSQYVQTKVAEQRAYLLDLKRNKKVCKTWTSLFTERLCPSALGFSLFTASICPRVQRVHRAALP